MSSRIQILDSYRTIAIGVVLLYHYYYRWGPLLGFEGVKLFELGKYGVHFFFVISGFVIHYTLLRKDSLLAFYKARLIRLLPTMILFSCVTFIFFQLFPLDIHPRFNTKWSDLLANWTFVNPVLLNEMFNARFTYVEPAYWSLWYEVRFYLWVGLIFFLSKKHFLRNWIIFTVLLNAWMYLPDVGLSRKFVFYFNNLLPVEWINYFALGIVFFLIYSEKLSREHLIYLGLLVFAELMRIWQFGLLYNMEAFLIILVFFSLFSFKAPIPKFMENRFMVDTGRASYGLYLIHQNVGIALMYFMLQRLSVHPAMAALAVSILFVLISLGSYKYIEKPVIAVLNKWTNKNQN